MRVLAVAALLAAFLFLAPLMAHAAPTTLMAPTPCVPVADLAQINKQHGEYPVGDERRGYFCIFMPPNT